MQRPRAFSLLSNRLETGRIVLYGLGVGGLVGTAGTLFTFLLDAVRAWLLQASTGFHPLGLPSEGGVLQAFAGQRAWLLPVLMGLGVAAAAWLEGGRRRRATVASTEASVEATSSEGLPGLAVAAPVERPAGEVQARGDGVDAALAAYHQGRARFRAGDVAARSVAGLVALGVGAPLGREGPLAALAAGLGALFGHWGRLSEEDRRLVFIAGLAAGLGLVLRAPLAGAVLAVEMLYRRFEFEYEALTPAVLASVVAYAIYGVTRGFAPLLEMPAVIGQPNALLPAFLLLGLVEALAAAGFVLALRAVGGAWDVLRAPAWLRLVVAGVLSGLIVLAAPAALGEGLGWSQLSLSNYLWPDDLTGLLFWRTLAVVLLAGSGAAGGLITPSLVIGGAIGSLFATGISSLFPGANLDNAAFTLTGMAAFMAGALNAPLAATLLITEWSGYGLLIPLLLTTAAGYALIGREGVLRSQPESRSASPVHIAEYLRGAVQLAGAAIQAAAPREAAPAPTPAATPTPSPALTPQPAAAPAMPWYRSWRSRQEPKIEEPAPVVVETTSVEPPPLEEVVVVVESDTPPPPPATLDVTNPVPVLLAMLSGESLQVSGDDTERLYRMPVPGPWIGQAVRDLEWPPQAILVAIVREGQVKVPRGSTVLEADDSLVVMADPETYARFVEPAPVA